MNITISESFSFEPHLSKIKYCYSGVDNFSNNFSTISHLLVDDLFSDSRGLSYINVKLFRSFALLAGISPQVYFASEINLNLNSMSPTERLLKICKSFQATQYLSSIGAKNYMLPELSKFYESGIEVLWQDFIHSSYINSSGMKFVSHLSIVDFIMNCGI